MNPMSTKLMAAGVLGILTLISGVIVSSAGRPLNPALFNIHKIIAVVAIVLTVVAVVQLYQAGEATALLEMGAAILTGLLFVALVVTGGMLSFEREWPAMVLLVHQIAPLLSVGFAAMTLYLLYRGAALGG